MNVGRPSLLPLEHGSTRLYARGCRCLRCGIAYSNLQRETRERLNRGDGDYVVSAQVARDHLRYLSTHGVGYRAVFDCTGIYPRVVQAIRQGRWKRIRLSTEAKILRVGAEAKSGCSYVSSKHAVAQLRALLAMGYLRKEIAAEVGYRSAAIQWARSARITVRTELKMDAAFKRLSARQTRGVPRRDIERDN